MDVSFAPDRLPKTFKTLSNSYGSWHWNVGRGRSPVPLFAAAHVAMAHHTPIACREGTCSRVQVPKAPGAVSGAHIQFLPAFRLGLLAEGLHVHVGSGHVIAGGLGKWSARVYSSTGLEGPERLTKSSLWGIEPRRWRLPFPSETYAAIMLHALCLLATGSCSNCFLTFLCLYLPSKYKFFLISVACDLTPDFLDLEHSGFCQAHRALREYRL